MNEVQEILADSGGVELASLDDATATAAGGREGGGEGRRAVNRSLSALMKEEGSLSVPTTPTGGASSKAGRGLTRSGSLRERLGLQELQIAVPGKRSGTEGAQQAEEEKEEEEGGSSGAEVGLANALLQQGCASTCPFYVHIHRHRVATNVTVADETIYFNIDDAYCIRKAELIDLRRVAERPVLIRTVDAASTPLSFASSHSGGAGGRASGHTGSSSNSSSTNSSTEVIADHLSGVAIASAHSQPPNHALATQLPPPPHAAAFSSLPLLSPRVPGSAPVLPVVTPRYRTVPSPAMSPHGPLSASAVAGMRTPPASMFSRAAAPPHPGAAHGEAHSEHLSAVAEEDSSSAAAAAAAAAGGGGGGGIGSKGAKADPSFAAAGSLQAVGANQASGSAPSGPSAAVSGRGSGSGGGGGAAPVSPSSLLSMSPTAAAAGLLEEIMGAAALNPAAAEELGLETWEVVLRDGPPPPAPAAPAPLAVPSLPGEAGQDPELLLQQRAGREGVRQPLVEQDGEAGNGEGVKTRAFQFETTITGYQLVRDTIDFWFNSQSEDVNMSAEALELLSAAALAHTRNQRKRQQQQQQQWQPSHASSAGPDPLMPEAVTMPLLASHAVAHGKAALHSTPVSSSS